MKPLLLALLLMQPAAAASASPPATCAAAAGRAAERHSIPKDVLLAMVDVESGNWPFAIGVNTAGELGPLARRYAGRGYRAEDATTAAAWVRGLRSIGLTSLDVGCLQVNLRHHASAFATLEEAFDPEANADYAARHLAGLKAAHGSWERAVARYHAASLKPQVAYLCRVRAKLASRGWSVAADPRCGAGSTRESPAAAPKAEPALAASARSEREARSRSGYVVRP